MRNHVPVLAVGVLVIAALVAAIVGYRARFIVPIHDEPVAASIPRSSLVLEVALAARVACDEAFDLALYGDLGVELVVWDESARTCGERRVTVKYLPSRIRRARLLERIERLAISVKVVEG